MNESELLDAPSLAMVGVAKNCGKTTTLNYLVTRGVEQGRTMGLLSIGLDGEAKDLLLGTPKPGIGVRPGQLVVTVSQAFSKSSARFEYLESLGFETVLGEVLLGRVLDPGTVLLAGMRHREDVGRAVRLCRAHGADQVLVDGAYGRISAAQPGLTDAVVVATGAVLGADVGEVADRTAELLARLTLPIARGRHMELGEEASQRGAALVGGAAMPAVELSNRSALLALREAPAIWSDEADTIAIPGLLSDAIVELLLAVGGGPRRTVVVSDPTAVHVRPEMLRRFRGRWDLVVQRGVAIAAISINPTSVRGAALPRADLMRAIRALAPKTTVFDPLVGIC